MSHRKTIVPVRSHPLRHQPGEGRYLAWSVVDEQSSCCRSDLIEKLANLEGRPYADVDDNDHRSPRAADRLPDLTCRAWRSVSTSAKLAAYDLLNQESRAVAERRLFALVDAVSCLLAHGGRHGNEEAARLVLETVVDSTVALAAVRTLTDRPASR